MNVHEVRAMRILIADDHAALRRSLSRALADEPEMEVVGEASDGGSAVRMAKQLHPDIVFMDVVMPRLNGVDATRHIAKDCPDVRVIALSVHASRACARRMLQAGASGYVLKSGDLGELLEAIEAVIHGGTYLSPEIPAL